MAPTPAKRDVTTLFLTGTMVAFVAFAWTTFWTFNVWSDGEFRVPQPTIVVVPVVLSAWAVLVGNRRSAPTIRFVAGTALFLWGMFLFAWMFLVSGSLMTAAAGLSTVYQGKDTAAPTV